MNYKLIGLQCIVLLQFAFVACAPVYKKFYNYEPMRTESQRTCAVTCQLVKQSCISNQQQSYQLCQANARIEYQNCQSNERWGYNNKGEWECVYNCYCFQSYCNEPNLDTCDDQYATCYTGCGGKVTATTQCVSNCDKQ